MAGDNQAVGVEGARSSRFEDRARQAMFFGPSDSKNFGLLTGGISKTAFREYAVRQ